MPEASAYTPPSREPAEIAERLSAYIARNKAHAHRYVEGEADTPMIQFGYMAGLYMHIRRLEHQIRCFILFLAAQLIERGLVKPAPLKRWQRGTSDHTGPSPMIRRQDRELRALLADTPRLCTFSITTPVIEGGKRRSKRRVKSQYKLLPDSLKPVDARHLLARYGRLSRVLLRADVLATRLAGRALTVRLESTGNSRPSSATPSPLWGEGIGVRGYETSASSTVPDAAPQPHPKPFSFPGRRRALPSHHRESGNSLEPVLCGQNVRENNSKRRDAAGQTSPLYLQSLHSWLAPEPLWESAKDLEDERDDLTALHMMATESLTAAGFPPGPDPKLQLPRFEAWKPPDLPNIHLL